MKYLKTYEDFDVDKFLDRIITRKGEKPIDSLAQIYGAKKIRSIFETFKKEMRKMIKEDVEPHKIAAYISKQMKRIWPKGGTGVIDGVELNKLIKEFHDKYEIFPSGKNYLDSARIKVEMEKLPDVAPSEIENDYYKWYEQHKIKLREELKPEFEEFMKKLRNASQEERYEMARGIQKFEVLIGPKEIEEIMKLIPPPPKEDYEGEGYE